MTFSLHRSMFPQLQGALVVLLFVLLPCTEPHSWVEQLMVVGPNGTYVGVPGYPRGYVPRTAPGFSDSEMVNLIPPNGRPTGNEILPTDPMCRTSQQNPDQTPGSPRLQAPAGSMIALRYQENGHVTLPQNTPGKPANRGSVYIYGTTQPRSNDTLLAIHKVWNANGTGGDRRGSLVATQNFDDSQCYQVNGGNISTARQEEFKHPANPLSGADLWCQNDIILPTTAPAGKPYTLYWVWDWPTDAAAGGPGGKEEIYTTCMDIDVTAAAPAVAAAAAAPSADGGLVAAAGASAPDDMVHAKYVSQDYSDSAVSQLMDAAAQSLAGASSGTSPATGTSAATSAGTSTAASSSATLSATPLTASPANPGGNFAVLLLLLRPWLFQRFRLPRLRLLLLVRGLVPLVFRVSPALRVPLVSLVSLVSLLSSPLLLQPAQVEQAEQVHLVRPGLPV
ncbi:MAG: hypothetical protein M1838_001135 [Thelocarpon superellum]|nr:MAG: hypothetical protein M1838_001135 [Thelocarpon superellum]